MLEKIMLNFSVIAITAYRIHVNQSTVDVLNSLKLGYKIQVRGLTELKVNKIKNEKHIFTHFHIYMEYRQCIYSSIGLVIAASKFLKFISREKVLRTHTGWSGGKISTSLCLFLQTFRGKRTFSLFIHTCIHTVWCSFNLIFALHLYFVQIKYCSKN